MDQKDTFISSVYGFHPLMEAIYQGKTIEKIFLQKDLKGPQYQECMALLKDHKEIPIQRVPKEKLNRLTKKKHQGIYGLISPIDFYKVENLLPIIYEKGKAPCFLILDQITDVRNLGAIARSASAMNIDGLIISTKGSAPISGDAIKTSAGGIFHIPICKEENLKKTLIYLKNSGVLLFSTSSLKNNSIALPNVDFSIPVAILIGNEEKGVSKELSNLCFKSINIPISKKIESLNVSVACGIISYEIFKQRNKFD